MKIGFVALGKMGLPLAVTMSYKGYDVMGYDVDASRMTTKPQEYRETGPDGDGNFNDWLKESNIRFGSLKEVVNHGEIVFVAVQTPHDPMYEGITQLPDKKVDFDYSHLRLAVRGIKEVTQHPILLVVMSTVLPGTMKREIEPIIENDPNITLVYNPSFIAMGTTMRDFLYPEFILVGTSNTKAAEWMGVFYEKITNAPMRQMSIESAELTKVAYNTYISLKIAFVNTVMEICEKFENADCDDVTEALKSAKVRLISGAYMSGGMGDGGGCHPRDNIAMSWLAKTQGLSFDIFEAAMLCREKQAQWLAEILAKEHEKRNLPVVILGMAFKPETNLLIGSPALLVGNLLFRKWKIEPVYVEDEIHTTPSEVEIIKTQSVFLIGCRHQRYPALRFAKGSVVIDPHRYIPDAPNGEYGVRRLGEGLKIG